MYPDIEWDSEPDIGRLREAYCKLPHNPTESLETLEQLACQGSVASMWYLGDTFANGRYLEKDPSRARFWFAKANEAGWVPAPYMLGRVAFESGDYASAFAGFSEGAAKAHIPATYRLAMMYQDGLGSSRDINKARDLLDFASRKGHLFATRELAKLYLSGKFGARKVAIGLGLILSLLLDLVGIAISRGWRSSEFQERILA